MAHRQQTARRSVRLSLYTTVDGKREKNVKGLFALFQQSTNYVDPLLHFRDDSEIRALLVYYRKPKLIINDANIAGPNVNMNQKDFERKMNKKNRPE